jgi:imidazolonepropionase-like amidohydrolase
VLDAPFVQRFAGRHVPTATTIAGGLLWFFDRPTYARLVLADPRLLASLPDSARIAEQATLARDTSLGPSHDTTFAYTRSHLASYRATVGRNARALLDAGAPLAVGSDGPVGVATHLEMELMLEGGLTTAEVLTAATIGGARLLGLEDELGTIAPRKRADIVGLRADPLKDVRNARDVAWVIKAGHVVDRASTAR